MNSKKTLEEFITQSDNGFVKIDNDYCIISVNNAVIELSGYSIDELEGAALEFLFDAITADKICKIYNSFKCCEINHKIYGELLTKTAKSRTVEVSINCSGEVDDFSCWLLIKNKTSNMEMESKLKQSELMLHTAIESLPFDFWINDAENRTYLQNSYSKGLWGDVKGSTPSEVTDDENINKNWLESTGRALNGEIVNGEITYKINGKKKYYRNIVAPIKDEEHLFGILGMNIDITDLRESVNMRDMLLKEVHHRVKNNLQMIIGIIKLEESEFCNDKEDCSVLDDIIHRIKVISMVHEKLYQVDINNLILVSDYIRSLVEQIVSGSSIDDLELRFDLEDPVVETDRIILIGLIINELVTNSLKYAFNSAGNNLLEVKLQKKGETIEVELSDNGPGLPNDFGVNSSSSLGMRMINAFIQQLGGKLTWSSGDEGTTFSLNFPIKKAEAV